MARLTSDFFVSQLMRRVSGAGGFATIAKKGASEAGAVYIIVRARYGMIQLFGPAPQHVYDDNRPSERYFTKVETVASEVDMSTFVSAETRFDPDFWLIELEIDLPAAPYPFEITKL